MSIVDSLKNMFRRASRVNSLGDIFQDNKALKKLESFCEKRQQMDNYNFILEVQAYKKDPTHFRFLVICNRYLFENNLNIRDEDKVLRFNGKGTEFDRLYKEIYLLLHENVWKDPEFSKLVK